MTELETNLDRVKLAARLYHVDGLSQGEVGKILEVSQAMVSRFLRQAREKGIVRITVDEYQPRETGLEGELRRTYPKLKQVVVVRDPVEGSIAGIRRNVGYFAAPVIAEMITPGRVIGVTGGRTLAELIKRVNRTEGRRDLRVVPLMGSIGAVVNESDAAELSRTLAEEFWGACYALNMPAFVSTTAGRSALMEQQQVRVVWGLYGAMTLALVGIGTLKDSAFIDRGILSEQDLGRLRRAGAVGEICGRYFNGDGKECATDLRKRVVSIELEELRKMPEVVGVTAGTGRGEAVAVAVRTGLVNSLVVDECCAREMLGHAAMGKRGGKAVPM
ncbi:MAG TPA: sugar-binding domain-containing protein [Tepidisphaeraceae bacterium]|jgi:DNA-binding transcriptional regulator LsrR (DeoR family)|nr:sugar-binding domain-containing protein [Tepidisphaeraceae bacterium]